jgi:hypothetical protein
MISCRLFFSFSSFWSLSNFPLIRLQM